MIFFGKRLSEYVAFVKPFLGLILVVGIARLALSLGGAPEYSFGGDGKTWLHVGAHLLIGTTIGSLVSWLVGCLIMFATKKLATRGKETKAAARA